MRHQDVAADPRRSCIFLHAGVLGVETLDRSGMIAETTVAMNSSRRARVGMGPPAIKLKIRYSDRESR
jgi:hypothetical protein